MMLTRAIGLSVTSLLVVVAALLLSGCPAEVRPENTVREAIPVPATGQTLYLFYRNAGASAAETCHLAVLEKGEVFGNGVTGNVFIAEQAPSVVVTVDGRTVRVVHTVTARVVKAEKKAKGLVFVYGGR